MGYLFAFLVVLLLLGIAALLGRAPTQGRITTPWRAEYWIYIPGTTMPEQSQIFDRLMGKNPHNPPQSHLIGSREGMLISDIRLTMDIILRERNAHVFHPEQIESVAMAPGDVTTLLEPANAVIRARYISEEPLPDCRHLMFLTHLADSLADLGNAVAIYDLPGSRLESIPQFRERLQADVRAESAAFHVRSEWVETSEGGKVQSFGLNKIGLFEIQTMPGPRDHRVLLESIVNQIVAERWATRAEPTSFTIHASFDRFLCQATLTPSKEWQVHVMRVQDVES